MIVDMEVFIMLLKELFWFSGIWIMPISLIASFCVSRLFQVFRELYGATEIVYSPMFLVLGKWVPVFIAVLPSVCILMINIYAYVCEGKRDFCPHSWSHSFSRTNDKRKAMTPKISSVYLSKIPDGFTFGRYKNRFVRLPINKNNIMHTLIVGSPGAMKSTTLLNALIWNFNFASKKDKMTVFAIDIKPELQRKSCNINDPFVRVINPASFDKVYWGFDAYYGLSQKSSDDEVEERIDAIVRRLISTSKSHERNEIFYETARNILVTFLLYGFRKGLGFYNSITKMLSVSMKNLIIEILTDRKVLEAHPKLNMLLRGYDHDDSQFLNDVEATMRQDLRVFSIKSVKYFFKDNPRKVSPENLTDGISLFLSLPDHLLEQYRPLFRMITQLTLNYLSSLSERERSENDVPLIWLLIDEFGSIGNLQIKEPLARLRSRRISIWLCVQGLSQLDEIYGAEGRRTILNNCEVNMIFSSRDDVSNKFFSDLAGVYQETKISTNRRTNGGGGDSSESISKETRPIFDNSDFARLRVEKKMICFVEGSFMLVDKCPYFKIKQLLEKSDEIKAVNDRSMSDETI